jgi:1,2-dihydroxy-3-keto-5-methylthiopentene dioxygenase
MQLYWLDAKAETPPCSTDDLAQIGVTYRQLSTDRAVYEPAIAALCQSNGYIARDEVKLSPDTANLDGLLDKFKGEHRHDEDEVRLVLSGAGIFDLRAIDERWIRVEVVAGDLLVVPKGLYHRFFLTADRAIHCVRLFQDPAGWQAIYRPAAAMVGVTAPSSL